MHCLHPTTPPPSLPSPSKQKVEIAEFTVIGIGVGGGGVGDWTQDNNFWELFWDYGLKQMAE